MTKKLFFIGSLVVILACAVSACTTSGRSVSVSHTIPMALEPSDVFNGMQLTRGGTGAVSVWEVCRSAIGTTRECRVAPGHKLAIGPNTLAMFAAGTVADWGQSTWALYLDEHPINLDSFGTVDFVRPEKGFNGYSEVFRVQRAWDVIIAPTPGRHTLRTVVQFGDQANNAAAASGNGLLSWTINLKVGR